VLQEQHVEPLSLSVIGSTCHAAERHHVIRANNTANNDAGHATQGISSSLLFIAGNKKSSNDDDSAPAMCWIQQYGNTVAVVV